MKRNTFQSFDQNKPIVLTNRIILTFHLERKEKNRTFDEEKEVKGLLKLTKNLP